MTVAGKTGTTEGYGDAWFVGWTPQFTVAVWVGYPNAFKPMETEFAGQPVAGGTYPASIFRTFVGAVAEPEEDEEVDADCAGALDGRARAGARGAGRPRARGPRAGRARGPAGRARTSARRAAARGRRCTCAGGWRGRAVVGRPPATFVRPPAAPEATAATRPARPRRRTATAARPPW